MRFYARNSAIKLEYAKAKGKYKLKYIQGDPKFMV